MEQDFKQGNGKDVLSLVPMSCCLLLRLSSCASFSVILFQGPFSMNLFLMAQVPLLKVVLGTEINYVVSQMPIHYLPHGTF